MIVLAQRTVLWTAVTALLSWLLPRRLQMPAVVLSTCLFLAAADRAALGLMAAQTAAVLWALPRARRRGVFTAVLVGLLAAVLAAFKLGAGRIAMPLGVSFMAFRLVHLLVDAYAGRLPRHDPESVLAYLLFLPPMAAGPIHRFPEFLVDLRRRRFDAELLGRGLERVLHGYAKLVILRNLLVLPLVVPALSRWAGSFPGDVLAGAGQWLDLYITFSGASDLAIGYALVMGFRIQENFRFPFLAGSIQDFWRRWHISLTLWCRDYVYAPVAAATRRPLLGIAVAMVVIGLWHEASLRYILWGLYHAGGIVASRRLAAALPAPERWRWLLRPLATAATLLFVVSSYAVTSRADAALKAFRPSLSWRSSHACLPLPPPPAAMGGHPGRALVRAPGGRDPALLPAPLQWLRVP